jgi:hypothetical protein
LRAKLGEGFAYRSAARLSEDDQHLRDASAVIVADVDVGELPPGVLLTVSSRGIPLLVLGGEHLHGWTQQHFVSLPVILPRAYTYLGEDQTGAGVVVSEQAKAAESFAKCKLALRLDLVQEAQLRSGAVLMCGVETDHGVLPLLAADDVARPRRAVVLTDTTWKWARSPDGAVRADYQAFWSSCIAWLQAAEGSSSALVLAVEAGGAQDEGIRGWVAAAVPDANTALEHCRVIVSPGGQTVDARREGNEGRWYFRLEKEEEGMEADVVWLQAVAEQSGTELTSERVPVAVNHHLREFQNVRADGDLLHRFTTGEDDSFAWYPDREAVIKRLFREAAVQAGSLTVEKRDARYEFVLAVLVFVFLGIEWWFERRRYGGS